jgi:hypothetical protein
VSSSAPRYVRTHDVLTREVETAILLLRPKGGDVLSLSGAGTAIWDLLRRPMTLDDLVHSLAERYHVAPEDIVNDVRDTVDSLLEQALLRRAAA